MTRPATVVFAYHDVGYECLQALIGNGSNVVAVFTHDDDPAEKIWFKSVSALAREHGIPVHAPASVNTPGWINRIRELRPQILFSFYYRNLICQEILDIPALGAFNMHGSLLPRYRGRVPVNWAVLNGETHTGATLHVMVKRPDAGDIVDQEEVLIGPADTALQVFGRVTAAARQVLVRQIDAIEAGRPPRRVQDEAMASYFGGRRPEDGRIDWTQPAQRIYNLIRAVTHPYPGAFTELDGRRLYLWRAVPRLEGTGIPGEVLSTEPLIVATGSGCLDVITLQWQNGAEQAAADGQHGLRRGLRLGVALAAPGQSVQIFSTET
ncbi:MAG: formyltransferase [Pseudomonadota bacterium]|nr:formyltransferase [Pseudomonadota bacterium]